MADVDDAAIHETHTEPDGDAGAVLSEDKVMGVSEKQS